MALGLIFVLGIGNFAFHKAVLESRHPMLDRLPRLVRRKNGRMSLLFEFFVLITAMLLAVGVWPGAVWAYAIYSFANLFSGWLLLSGRV